MSESTPTNTDAHVPAKKPNGSGHAYPQPSRFRRWARETFTREQMVAGLKQLAWVAPLTLLIWVYAEREQQVRAPDIRFSVEVRSNDPKVAVTLIDPADGTVSVDLRGPRNELDRLRGDIGSRANTVRYEVPAAYLKEGTHQIPVTAVVARDVRFEGMSILNVPPPRITVLVDPIDEVKGIDVKVREEDKATFADVDFLPKKVTVRMPRTAMAAAMKKSQSDQPVVYADLTAVRDKTPGRKTDVSGIRVYVANADEADVTIEPSTVTASFDVREKQDEYLIEAVQIREMPATQLRELVTVKLSGPPSLFNIRVVGPPAAIEQVRQAKGANVMALVSIDLEDRDMPPHRKPVTFWLPDGVKVHPDDATQSVEVKVTTRG